MPEAFYLVPYKLLSTTPWPRRACAMDDFTAVIRTDGGTWEEIQVNPRAADKYGTALVKVVASAQTLNDLEAVFTKLPNAAAARAQVPSALQRSQYDKAKDEWVYSGPADKPLRTTFDELDQKVKDRG